MAGCNTCNTQKPPYRTPSRVQQQQSNQAQPAKEQYISLVQYNPFLSQHSAHDAYKSEDEWKRASEPIKSNLDYYKNILKDDVMVLTQGSNKMYIAPVSTDSGSVSHNVRKADMTQLKEVPYDPALAEAYKLKTTYKNMWDQVVQVDYATKSDYDKRRTAAIMGNYYKNILPQRSAEIKAKIDAGILERKGTGLVETADYVNAKVQQEALQKGMVAVQGVKGISLLVPKSVAESINKDSAAWVNTNPGSLSQDLGLAPMPLSRELSYLKPVQREYYNSWLQSKWSELGRPECWERFSKGFTGNPTGYVNMLHTRDVDNYNSFAKQIESKYSTYISDGKWVGNESLYKQYQSDVNKIDLMKKSVDEKTAKYTDLLSLGFYDTMPSSLTCGSCGSSRSQRYNYKRKPAAKKRNKDIKKSFNRAMDIFITGNTKMNDTTDKVMPRATRVEGSMKSMSRKTTNFLDMLDRKMKKKR